MFRRIERVNATMGHETARQDLPSFGRRRGRRLSAAQAALIERLEASPHIKLGSPPPATPASLFPLKPVRETWLEIGFGGGEHLIAQARQNSDIGLIGAEPFVDGVVKVLSEIESSGLKNVLVHPDDVRPLLRWLPAGSITRTFILFPDPWPKRKHVKRRLLSASTLDLIARAMVQSGELRIATDIGDYLRTILVAVGQCGQFEWQAREARDWRDRPSDWPRTRYEHKAEQEGRRAYYLRFLRM